MSEPLLCRPPLAAPGKASRRRSRGAFRAQLVTPRGISFRKTLRYKRRQSPSAGENRVKSPVYLLAVLTVTFLAMDTAGRAQSSEAPAVSSVEARGGVPIEQIVAVIARKDGKRFVLDPRVHANVVLIGSTPAELTYAEFLTVLEVYGFAAVENGKLVRIVPDANLRQYATPVITGKDTFPGSEFVTEIITLKNVSAPQLIPILRPMVSQYGHLASYPGTNTLMLSDHFDNVRRLEGIIRTFDSEKPRPMESAVTAPATEH
jgi:type II secretory pathway component GspD/PulD (secretin)